MNAFEDDSATRVYAKLGEWKCISCPKDDELTGRRDEHLMA